MGGSPRNPGRVAKLPGCIQPSPVPWPAGDQARGPRGQVATASGALPGYEAVARLGDTVAGRGWRGDLGRSRAVWELEPGSRTLTARSLSGVRLLPRRIPPGAASAGGCSGLRANSRRGAGLGRRPRAPAQGWRLRREPGSPRPFRAQLRVARSCARSSAGRPARYLQGARAAISSPSRVLKLRQLPCPPPPGEGPPSPSHPAATRPPPRRFPLAAACSCLVPPPAARPSVPLSITHALLFRSLVRIGVTSEQGARGEGGAGADGFAVEARVQLGRQTASVPGPGLCSPGIRAL